MSDKRLAVVTGAAGFIGSHMVDLLLARGFRVRAIDNLTGGRLANLAHHRDDPDLVFEEQDIRHIEPEDALFHDARYVFHFAGIGDIVPSVERPLDYMDTNVQGTFRVLEASRHVGVSGSWCTLLPHHATDWPGKSPRRKGRRSTRGIRTP